MPKVRMHDVVIVLPGIMGSVLEKDGKEIWVPSARFLWELLTNNLQQLILQGDSLDVGVMDDGVSATRVFPDAYVIPGLIKVRDGYSAISRFIKDNFEVIPGSLDNNNPANFFEFPYDWRHDNRISARRLKQLIDLRLPQWRKYTGVSDAKVILLAHSMGGLVSRYYLEVLEGWRDCRALITFGTPYRGSVDALNSLANGFKKVIVNLTDLVRSLTSLYQLLPIYEMLKVEGKYKRVAETDGVPGIVKAKAEAALAFHREIEAAVNSHLDNDEYQKNGYKIVPVVGIRQPTLQSAELSGGRLTVSREIPEGMNPLLQDGDGTVPYLSAIPIELSAEFRDSFIAERHSSLQSNDQVLNDLYNRLKQTQLGSVLSAIRGPEISPKVREKSSISLDLEDLYLAGESIALYARVNQWQEHPGGLQAVIEQVENSIDPIQAEFEEHEEGCRLSLDELPAGLYRLEVRTRKAGPQAPTPVHDLFEVLR